MFHSRNETRGQVGNRWNVVNADGTVSAGPSSLSLTRALSLLRANRITSSAAFAIQRCCVAPTVCLHVDVACSVDACWSECFPARVCLCVCSVNVDVREVLSIETGGCVCQLVRRVGLIPYVLCIRGKYTLNSLCLQVLTV